jgi:hypothetical protein
MARVSCLGTFTGQPKYHVICPPGWFFDITGTYSLLLPRYRTVMCVLQKQALVDRYVEEQPYSVTRDIP